MEERLLSIPRVGKYLGYGGQTLGRTSVYEHIKCGRLVRVKLQGRTFVTKDSADELIRKNIVGS